MITAAEAKTRAQNSKERVTQFLEVLGAEIVKLADEGKFEYEYRGGLRYDPTDTAKLIGATFATIPTPDFWKLVAEALKSYPNNYQVKIEKSAPYTPHGLGMIDDPEEQCHLSMKIMWK